MTTALTISKTDRRKETKAKNADRTLEYFKAGMDVVKPVVTSKPFLAISGSIILYKLEQAHKIDGVSAGLFTGALLAWMASDVIGGAISAISPFD
jgi:hypothetical protein